jgi:hypothetical protein
MAKKEAFLQFLKAARSLADQGLSKEAIMNFAKNEFGEISELFKKQIDSLFKPKQGIENIKIKDPEFDDTVVEMQFDEFGPFNPKDPLKNVSKQTKPMRYRDPDEFDTRKQYEEYLDAVLGPPDDVFGSPLKDDLLKAWDKVKIKNVTSKKTKALSYEEAIAREEAKAAADEDYIMKVFDPEDFASGGIAGYYTGGMVDVEPNLSDIGHGSDSLMARTRLVSPGNQATTSTGLNYLLAEDNDNLRVPFSKGKLADAARRKFMKVAGAGAAGLAALKTGLLGFGKEAAPVVEKAVETVQGAPSYFFDLVSKIKMFGKQSKVGPSEMMNEFSYTGKNGDQYTLTEDIATGDVQIVKDKMGVGSYGDKTYDTINDRSVLEFRAGRMDVKDEGLETQKGFKDADEYEEYKVEFDSDGTEAGAEAIDESVQKEILEEASEKITKKADGGRIGYSKGKAVVSLMELIKNPQKIKEAVKNIFKTGDYKYDAEMAAESLVELNPKAFGNKLYEDLDEKTRMEIYGAVLPEVRTPIKSFAAEVENVKKVAPQMGERFELKAKYPGITDDLLDKILVDDNPQRKAEVIATIDEAFKMMNKGKGPEEIIETFKNTTRTKQASGGLAKMLGE